MFRNDTVFARFMTTACDVLVIGILWLVCCIPLVTAGASTTAAYYTMSKSVRHKTGYIRKEFFHSFRENFKQSLVISIIFLVVAAVLIADIWYLWMNDNQLNSALFIVVLGITFCFLCITFFFCPLLSRFQKNNVEMIKTSAITAFRYLPITIAVIVVFVFACIGVWLMPWAIFIIPGLYLYLLTYPMEYIMKKMMPVPEEGSEEAEKWYYQ